MYQTEIILFVLLTFVTVSINAQDVCVKRNPCSCMFSNGTGIDLTPTNTTTVYTTATYQKKKNGLQYRMETFYFHPCTDFKITPDDSEPKDNVTNYCLDPVALCDHTYTLEKNAITNTFTMTGNIYANIGYSNKTIFSNDGRSIIYNNAASNTTVLLICSQVDDRLYIHSLDDPHEMVLAFYSRDACLKQIEQPGRSVGSTLLIVFFSLVIFYLVLGVCTKKFLMGATGIEVIPNLAFWTDLPNLVREGWAFAINGFKLPTRTGPTSSPDPNSYDSI
ncbi:uncharacterized protein LOC131855038 [Achroia grisella]|uniref:uncharacterized protein LOC131855038 n=1 Tax=Achroia grisella TaxID=688607 RepID=UPI0027D27DDC|nr:uncharacterized protein LOC131855038 [Achroia grisella]